MLRGDFSGLTIKRKCELLGVCRSRIYYKPRGKTPETLEFEELIRAHIDFIHTNQCYLGVKKLSKKISEQLGRTVGKKLVRRLMREMGIFAVYPKPNLSKSNKEHKKYPYLLRNKLIFLPNQVWAIDITYIKMGRSHMYLTAIIDWHSRFIVGWELSDTLETAPVLEALKKAVKQYGVPAIINSDQGSQFTSDEYTEYLKSLKIRQSMDGKARWVDNVIIERWFRNLKCEDIYIKEYNSPKELLLGVSAYIKEYNTERPHQSLDYQYPINVYHMKFVA